MKKIILSKIFLLISFVVLFSLSCKKEQATDDERLIRDAKTWYQNTAKKSTFLMRSSENKKEGIKQELDWSKAKAYILDDATDVLGVPMKIVRNGVSATGSYLMCITKVNGKFNPLVLYNGKEDYFSGTLGNEEMQKAYTEAVTITVSKKKALSQTSQKGRLSLEQNPQPPICIDWYWTEITYDYQGNIISIEENYLYSICYPNGGNPPGGGGGGGGLPPDDEDPPSLDWGNPVSISEGMSPEYSEVVGIDTFRVSNVFWTFHSGGTYHFRSIERGAIKVNGGQRIYHSLNHQGISRTGSIYLGDINVENIIPHAIISSTQATMELNYKLHITITAGLFSANYISKPVDSYGTWDNYFRKL